MNSQSIDRLNERLKGSELYVNKTPEEAQAMFDQEVQVLTPRINGWITRSERWKVAFYAQKLPRLTERKNCCVHLYNIAVKFNISLATVNNYRYYSGW